MKCPECGEPTRLECASCSWIAPITGHPDSSASVKRVAELELELADVNADLRECLDEHKQLSGLVKYYEEHLTLPTAPFRVLPGGAVARTIDAIKVADLIRLLPALKRMVESSPCLNGCAPDDMTCDTMFALAAIARVEKGGI